MVNVQNFYNSLHLPLKSNEHFLESSYLDENHSVPNYILMWTYLLKKYMQSSKKDSQNQIIHDIKTKI